jgi:hypothetical protein
MPVAILDVDLHAASYAMATCGEIHRVVAAAIAEERERAAMAAEWFANVEKFTAADVAKRIRERR